MQAKQVFTKLIFTSLRYLTTVLVSGSAFADVNLQQASYYKTWTDFTVTSKNVKYSFQRTYKSRSIHQGLFGFGWCTDFEKKLDLNSKTEIILKDCQEDHFLRFTKRGKNYVSTADPKDKILVVGDQFQRQKGLIQQVFDAEGKLIRLQFFKWPLEIFYDHNQQISSLKINHDQSISLKFTPRNGDLLTVTAPRKAAFVYRLKNKNLISVSSADAIETNYSYSPTHNLVLIERAGKTLESMTYNEQKDWLIGTATSGECKETFSYSADSKKPLLFKAIIQKYCNGELKKETQVTYELTPVFTGGYRITRTFSREKNLGPRLAEKNGDSFND